MATLGAPTLARPPVKQPTSFARPPAARISPTGGVSPAAVTGQLQGKLPAPGSPRINPGGAVQGLRPAARPPARPVTPRPVAPKPVVPKPVAVAPKPPAPAPAPVPYNIGLVPADEQAKAAATTTYGLDASTALRSLQNQAMTYGDPSVMAGLGLGTTVNPNSTLAMAALRAQNSQLAATSARERAGTLFSSLALQDRQNIMDAQQRAQLGGWNTYQNALGNFNLAMTRAQAAQQQAIDNANLDERQNALNQLPTANTAAGGFQTGTTNIRSRVPAPSPKAPAKAKTPTLKGPQVPKTKGKLPSVGSKKAPVSNKPTKPSTVKKVTAKKPTTKKSTTTVPPRLIKAAATK